MKYDERRKTFLNKIKFNDKYFVLAQWDWLYCIVKSECFNDHEFDLEDYFGGVPHTWYFSGQSFITLLQLV